MSTYDNEPTEKDMGLEWEDVENSSTDNDITLEGDDLAITGNSITVPNFDGDDGDGFDTGISGALKTTSTVTIKLQKIDIDSIVTSEFKKVGRSKTVIGLTGVISEYGVVTPIHVMKLESDMFMLMDGLRRVFGALRSGISEVNAVVWDFSNRAEGKEKANLISLMLNRSQRFKNIELWEQHKLLKEINGATPNMIEFLLQLQPGDAMKLEDVMLSDAEYAEIREDFIEDLLTIEGAYKKLSNERKKENRLAKDDRMIIDGDDIPTDAEELMASVEDKQSLSVDSALEVLEMLDDNSLDSLTADEMHENMEGYVDEEEHVQDPKNRHPLDQKLRTAVLERDNFTCQCCGIGGKARLSNLAVHHIVEVVQGGPDTEKNLVTVCLNCHNLIHCISWGKVNVILKDLPEKEQEEFKKIILYANVIIEADKKRGKSLKNKEKVAGYNPTRHPFPGEGLKDNLQAFNASSK